MTEAGGGLFYTLGHFVARFPVLVIAIGIAVAVSLATGLIDPPFETELNNLWIEKGGRVDTELQYVDDNSIDGTRSTTELWTTVAVPFGNVLTADVLTDHLRTAEAMTTMTVTIDAGTSDEFTVDMKDICRSGAADYIIQCTRVTVLDCFYEGRYDLPTSPTDEAEIAVMTANVVSDPVGLATVSSTVESLRGTTCPTDVNGDPIYNWGKAYPGIPANSQPPLLEDADGNLVLDANGAPQPDLLAILCGILDGIADFTATTPGPNGDPINTYQPYGLGTTEFAYPYKDIAQNPFTLTTGPYTVSTLPDPTLQATTVSALITLGYVFQGDVVGLEDTLAQLANGEAASFTNSRGAAYYQRPSFTGINPVLPGVADEATIQATGAGECKFWDNGEVLPTIPRDIILGQEDRNSEDFVAIEFVVYAIEAEALVEKVKSPWRSPALGGPLDITVDQAQRALDQWRVQFTEQVPNGDFEDHSRSNAFSSDSFDIILSEFSDASLPLVVGGYAILIIYAFFALRRPSTKCDKILVMSKSMVGGVGVLVVALGVGGGLGLACYVGIPLNATSTQVLPFLLLGLGVDDMFVIAHNIDEDFDVEIPVLIGQLMAVVGPSITLTSGTNAIAFAIGTLTPLPVVIDFASQAAISICVLYCMNLFVFPALLALNEHRMRAKRVDCLPCLTRDDFERGERSGKEGFLKDVILNRFYIPFLKSILGKVVVFLVFGVIFAIGMYGALEKVVLGLSIADVAPAGTQEYEWLTVRYNYFSFYDMQIAVQGDDQGFDYTTREGQQGMLELFERVSDTTHAVDDGTMWLHAFLQWGFPDHGLDCSGGSCVDNSAYDPSALPRLRDSYLYEMCTFAAVNPDPHDPTNTLSAFGPQALCRGDADSLLAAAEGLPSFDYFGGFTQNIELQVCAGTLATFAGNALNPFQADSAACIGTLFGNDPAAPDYATLLNKQIASSFGLPESAGGLSSAEETCITNYCGGSPAGSNSQALGQTVIDISSVGACPADPFSPHACHVSETDYYFVVGALVGANPALDLQNPNCDPQSVLTNGECGPLQDVVNDAGPSVAGCTSIFTAALPEMDLDYQGGPGNNAAAMCINLATAENPSLQCFTVESDYYYACINKFAQTSSAASLTSPYWYPDTGVLGGGTVDADGNARIVGQLGNEGSPFTYSEYSMYSFNLVENEDYVRLIEEVRDECTNSPVPAFPKGTGFLYWEQYLGLQETLLKNIIYALVSVFCVTFIMLIVVPKVDREKCWTLLAAAFGGAFTLVFILTLYMIEIYGFMGWMDIKLSALPAVSLIMAVGVGVEFTAHIILAFILAEGDRNDRMEAAMDHMFVPTIDGTISTFLGIVMLAFSDFEFIVKYYFLVYLIIVVLGCLNGLILLPALLAVCGPPSISLPPAGGSEVGYRRGSITSPKTSTNPALEMSAKPGSDFV
jgi:hypothetical protein